jgi:hypothetical protein
VTTNGVYDRGEIKRISFDHAKMRVLRKALGVASKGSD